MRVLVLNICTIIFTISSIVNNCSVVSVNMFSFFFVQSWYFSKCFDTVLNCSNSLVLMYLYFIALFSILILCLVYTSCAAYDDDDDDVMCFFSHGDITNQIGKNTTKLLNLHILYTKRNNFEMHLIQSRFYCKHKIGHWLWLRIRFVPKNVLFNALHTISILMKQSPTNFPTANMNMHMNRLHIQH